RRGDGADRRVETLAHHAVDRDHLRGPRRPAGRGERRAGDRAAAVGRPVVHAVPGVGAGVGADDRPGDGRGARVVPAPAPRLPGQGPRLLAGVLGLGKGRGVIPTPPISTVAHGLAALGGMWMMAAPAAFDYDGAAFNDQFVGPIVATFGIVAMWEVTRGVRWVNRVLAARMLPAALLLDYPVAGGVNAVATGAAVFALSLVRGRTRTRFGGGWASLFRPRHPATPP